MRLRTLFLSLLPPPPDTGTPAPHDSRSLFTGVFLTQTIARVLPLERRLHSPAGTVTHFDHRLRAAPSVCQALTGLSVLGNLTLFLRPFISFEQPPGLALWALDSQRAVREP